MGSKHSKPPEGLDERKPNWHFDRFVEFTGYKGLVGEPSPHLSIVGHMAKGKPLKSRLWLLGCYAATYCLPMAQVFWTIHDPDKVRKDLPGLKKWMTKHWDGVITRTERRCVRSPVNMAECLHSYAYWMEEEYPKLLQLPKELTPENYDVVWESAEGIKFFGRYIIIRFVEGLRRYFDVPARLYDVRSIGGWSPKRALCYLYPKHTETLLVDDAKGNALTNKLAEDLLKRVQTRLPKVDEYILAAMLCEYKAAFENYHQYPGWTLDQEPLLYDKVFAHWGKTVDKNALWEARKALFPPEALGEASGWHGTRWNLTKTLRDQGYVWSDLRYDFRKTWNINFPEERKGAYFEFVSSKA